MVEILCGSSFMQRRRKCCLVLIVVVVVVWWTSLLLRLLLLGSIVLKHGTRHGIRLAKHVFKRIRIGV